MIPNQGIYGFRGSDSTILEDYEKNHNPQVLHLTENHRSTPQIVEISNNLIVNNFSRIVNIFRHFSQFFLSVNCGVIVNRLAEKNNTQIWAGLPAKEKTPHRGVIKFG